MNDYFDSGFAVREPSWHRKETLLNEWPGTWEKAWKLANNGKPWEIKIERAYVAGKYDVEDTDYVFATRSDNDAILSCQHKSSTFITNAEYGQTIENVINALGVSVKFDTTVVLHGGKVIASTLYLPDDIYIPNDPSPYRQYYVFMIGHDKNVAFRFGMSNVRIVCANTQQAAENELKRNKSGYSIKHTKNWRDRVDAIVNQMHMMRAESEEFFEMARFFAGVPISEDKITDFLDKWIPWSTDMSTRAMNACMNKRAKFRELLETSPTTEGVRNFVWGLFQTAVEMSDHYTDSKNLDTEISRQLLSGDARKLSAMKALISL